MEAFHHYKLRDEQEKYFEQMKVQMAARLTRQTYLEDKVEGQDFVITGNT